MRPLESRIARVLARGSAVAVGLLGTGVVLMVVRGVSPLDVAPALGAARLALDLLTLHPAGFLWLGAIAVFCLPVARLLVAVPGFWRAGERARAIIGAATLAVIAAGVIIGLSGRA